MALHSDWLTPKLARCIEVRVSRKIVRISGKGRPPLVKLLRSTPATRLFLDCVFAQAFGVPAESVNAVELVRALGLGEIERRRADGRENAAIRKLDRAYASLDRAGLTQRNQGRLPRLQGIWGCGLRVQLPNHQPMTAQVPGHDWHHRRDLSLPATLWSSGWIAELTSTELAALISLFAERGQKAPVTMRAHKLQAMYGITDDTWRKARAGLERRGVVERSTVAGTRQSYRYEIDTERLLEPA